MASLAEEVIEIYPDKFNHNREFSRHYDISEAHQTLRSLCILDEEFQFNELVTWFCQTGFLLYEVEMISCRLSMGYMRSLVATMKNVDIPSYCISLVYCISSAPRLSKNTPFFFF